MSAAAPGKPRTPRPRQQPRRQTLLHTAQAGLFDSVDLLPEGLVFVPDFIGAADEAALLQIAAGLPLRDARYKTYTARRRVFAFGGRHVADADDDDDGHGAALPPQLGTMPAPLQALRAQLAAFAGIAAHDFVHAMVAEYSPGTPLGWHRDAPHYELIAGVSLGSAARLRFRPYTPWDDAEKAAVSNDTLLTLELAPRSAYLMRGPARWAWQHSVPPVPALRYSVTMRTGRVGVWPGASRAASLAASSGGAR